MILTVLYVLVTKFMYHMLNLYYHLVRMDGYNNGKMNTKA